MKLKISQIKNLIEENVKNIWGSEKMSGSNVWFVYVKNTEDINPAIESLEKIGFKVSDVIKNRKMDKPQNYWKNIMCTFEGVENTHYARQINKFERPQQQKEDKKVPAIFVESENAFCRVFEVWESYNGWYWYVLDYEDPADKNYTFGLVDGFEKELGYMDFTSIKSELGNKFWRVHKNDIPYSKNIEMKTISEVKELKSEYGDYNHLFAEVVA